MSSNQHDYYDLEYLKEISDGDENFIRELFQIFIEDVEKRLGLLQQAVEENNPDQRKSYAHSIRGAARNIGAHILEKDTHALEFDGQCDQNSEYSFERLGNLKEKFRITRSHIEAYLDS